MKSKEKRSSFIDILGFKVTLNIIMKSKVPVEDSILWDSLGRSPGVERTQGIFISAVHGAERVQG